MRSPLAVAVSLILAAAFLHGAGQPVVRFVTYDEAWPVMRAARRHSQGSPAAATLPPEAAGGDDRQARAEYLTWVKARDGEIRARVLLGEEDSLVPLLLFGTSYTKAPRLTRAFFEQAGREAAADGTGQAGVERAFARAFEQRTDDLLRRMAAPGGNQRLAWARATCERKGHRFGTPSGRAGAGRFLVETFARVTRESGDFAQAWSPTTGEANTPEALARRASAFARRGLAPDTSWPVNFALAEALAALASSDALSPGSIRRIALVGPGLDFVDKDEGRDYYPPQTLQPFAVIDALLATGLSREDSLTIATLDLSPRVNEHVGRLATWSVASHYDLQLVREANVGWTGAASAYFRRFGAGIGRDVPAAAPPPSAGLVDARAVRVDHTWLRRTTSLDLNVVCQRADLRAADRFDMVIATNVLLYYDGIEQALAVANLASMMAPGGLLLTNTRLDIVPGVGETKVGGLLTVFSDRPGDGEVVHAYRLGQR